MFPFNFSVEVSWTLYRLDEHAGSDQHAKDSERYSVAGEGATIDFLQHGHGALGLNPTCEGKRVGVFIGPPNRWAQPHMCGKTLPDQR